jgi:hypothetical protein
MIKEYLCMIAMTFAIPMQMTTFQPYALGFVLSSMGFGRHIALAKAYKFSPRPIELTIDTVEYHQ